MEIQSTTSRSDYSIPAAASSINKLTSSSSSFFSFDCSPCSVSSIDSFSSSPASGCVVPVSTPLPLNSTLYGASLTSRTLNRTPPCSIRNQNEPKKPTTTVETIVKKPNSDSASVATAAVVDSGNSVVATAAPVVGLRKVRRFHNLKASLVEQFQYLKVSPKDETASLNDDEEEEIDYEYELPASSFSLSSNAASVRSRSFQPSSMLSPSVIQPTKKLLARPESLFTTTSSSPSLISPSPVLRDDEDLQFLLDLEQGPASFIPLAPLAPSHQPIKPSNLDASLSNWKFRSRNYLGHRDHYPLQYQLSSPVWNKDDLYFAPHSPILSESPGSASNSPPPISNTIDPSRISHFNKSAPCIIPSAASSSSSSSSAFAAASSIHRRAPLPTNRNPNANWFNKFNDAEENSRRRSTSIPDKKEALAGQHKERMRPRTAPEDHDCQFEIEL